MGTDITTILYFIGSVITPKFLAEYVAGKSLGAVVDALRQSVQDDRPLSFEEELLVCMDSALEEFCRRKGWEYDVTAAAETFVISWETANNIALLDAEEIENLFERVLADVTGCNVDTSELELWTHCVRDAISKRQRLNNYYIHLKTDRILSNTNQNSVEQRKTADVESNDAPENQDSGNEHQSNSSHSDVKSGNIDEDCQDNDRYMEAHGTQHVTKKDELSENQECNNQYKKGKGRIIAGTVFVCVAVILLLYGIIASSIGSARTVESVTMSQNMVEMGKGDKLLLSAEVLYSDGSTDDNVGWLSGNSDIVTVDSDGTVEAVGKGSAVVTVSAELNGTSATAMCTITVNGPPEGYSISASTSVASLYEIFYIKIDTDDDVTAIQIIAEAPSGERYTLNKSWDDAYDIYAETGVWKIHAVIFNEYGSYEGAEEDEIVSIQITQ